MTWIIVAFIVGLGVGAVVGALFWMMPMYNAGREAGRAEQWQSEDQEYLRRNSGKE